VEANWFCMVSSKIGLSSWEECVVGGRRYHIHTRVFTLPTPISNHSCGTTSFEAAAEAELQIQPFLHHSLSTFACASMPCSLIFTPSHSFSNLSTPLFQYANFTLKSSSLALPTTFLFKPPLSIPILPVPTLPSPAKCSTKLHNPTYPHGTPSSTPVPKPA